MSDEQTVELMPCPFCGGKPYTRTTQDEDLSTHSTVDWHFVGCDNCDVSFGIPDGYDCGTASEQWNARAATLPALLAAEREKALREAAAELEVNWGHKATPEMRDAILALIDTNTEEPK